MRSRIVYMSNIISWKLYRYAFQNMEHKRKNIPIFHSIQSTHLMYNSLSDQWGVTDFVLQVPFICIRNIVVYTDQTKYIIILFSPLYIPTKNKYFISAESCCIMSVRARIILKSIAKFSFYIDWYLKLNGIMANTFFDLGNIFQNINLKIGKK